jgi:subfamily B ATP-binding cassette protein MsbA
LKDTVKPEIKAATGPSSGWEAFAVYRRLLTYLKPYRGQLALGMLGGVMYSAASWGFVSLSKILGDGTFMQRDAHTILWVPLLLVGIFALRGTGDFTQTYFMGYVGRHVVAGFRREVFRRLMRLPIGYFDRRSSGTLLSMLTFNSEQVAQATTDSVVVFVRGTLTIVAMIIGMLWINAKLTLLALTMGPLAGWLVNILNKHFRRYGRRIQDSMGDVTRVAKESFEAPRLIKVYNAEDHLNRQFDAVNESNLRSNMKMIFTRGLSNPSVQMVTAVGASLVLAIAISDAVHGRISVGDLVAFFVALTQIAQPLREVVGISGPLQQGITAGQSIFALLDEPTETDTGTHEVRRVQGEVRLENVSFAYESAKETAALRNVSLNVRAGETVAIVGRSGGGKSTLVNLLPRFYDADSGRVLIDGCEVRDYRLDNLREQIAVVSQDVVLFNDSIRNNIAFGREVSEERMMAVAEAARVLEFVRRLPAGLETFVGDRGVMLSGGQRQRIAIARALLKDAPILILDEATSALDTEAERHIQAALAQLMKNRTTLVIAHRLSTIEQADRILVVERGQIAESGTHTELLARGGLYAQLHRMQFQDAAPAPAALP